MTSRERIECALNHEQADRVAVDLGATNATGISAVVYNKLKKLLGIEGGGIRVVDIIQQLAEVEVPVLDALGGDVVMVRRLAMSLGIPFHNYKPGVLSDGTKCMQVENYNPEVNEKGEPVIYKLADGNDRLHPHPKGEPGFDAGKVIAKMPQGMHAYTRVYHPMPEVGSIEEIDNYVYPGVEDDEVDFLKREAERLYKTTDKALCGIFFGNVLEMGQIYWGYQKFFENMALEKDMMHHFFEVRTDAFVRDLERYLGAVGDYIQIIDFCDDLGSQSNLLMSPEMYREMVKPYHARMFQYVKNNYPNVKVFFHSCGAVYDIIPDFIEIGVDILNPIQITAKGMDPMRLKREFGKNLVLWGGGVDTQTTLNSGSVDDVRAQAREMLDIFAGGGGYVFSQVHNIEANVPAENVVAAFETAKNYVIK